MGGSNWLVLAPWHADASIVLARTRRAVLLAGFYQPAVTVDDEFDDDDDDLWDEVAWVDRVAEPLIIERWLAEHDDVQLDEQADERIAEAEGHGTHSAIDIYTVTTDPAGEWFAANVIDPAHCERMFGTSQPSRARVREHVSSITPQRWTAVMIPTYDHGPTPDGWALLGCSGD